VLHGGATQLYVRCPTGAGLGFPGTFRPSRIGTGELRLGRPFVAALPLDAPKARNYNVITGGGTASVRAKLIPIGNSRGVRLPKPLIKEAGLQDEVDIHVRDGTVVISSTKNPRSGWEQAARLLHQREGDRLLDGPVSTHFDETEWTW
jgi:antitoxin MazE